MAHTLYFIIISIIVIYYVFERILDYLNFRMIDSAIPDELADVFDPEQFKKSRLYEKESARFGFITSSLSFVLILGMLLFNGFSFVDDLVRSITVKPVPMALLFFGILMFASDLISIPFSIYSTFVIEQKYGFNTTTHKTFFLDKLKGWLLAAIIGGGLIALIVWFYQATTDLFWVYTWIAISVFSIFMAMFYSSLIVPLFNKQIPLEEGELRNAIEEFSKKVGFRLTNIFVINGSKRSTKANAYFSGFGPKKRIVLYDTLINDLSVNEIVAVLAHEIGHYKKKHIQTGMIISVIETGITLYVLSLFIGNPSLSASLGAKVSFHIGIVVFGIIYSPVSTIISLGMNFISRKNEYEADHFTKINFDAKYLINALKRLSAKNLTNITPHPYYVFFHYSHPTLLQRIRALN
ncbi:MAG: M48 family metallopeptidase [Bacteroidia bacterium]|nr:M48 family metallopeptidase [Bacteroidia bacterium]